LIAHWLKSLPWGHTDTKLGMQGNTKPNRHTAMRQSFFKASEKVARPARKAKHAAARTVHILQSSTRAEVRKSNPYRGYPADSYQCNGLI